MAPPQQRKSGGGQQQRTIASFFAASPSPSPSPSQAKKKPVLHIGPPPDGEECKRKSSPGASDGSSIKRCKGEPEAEARNVAPGAAAENSGQENVGKRLKVYWPREKKWFPGTVASFDVASGKHRVSYDDGDEEFVVLGQERLEWIDSSDDEEKAEVVFRDKKPARKKRQRVMSSDEGSGDKSVTKTKSEAADEDEGTPQPVRRRRLRKVVRSSPDQEEPKPQCSTVTVDNHQVAESSVRGVSSTRASPKSGKSILLEEDALKASDATTSQHCAEDQQILSGEAFERFGSRAASKFWFLGKNHRDASGRSREFPSFNPRTLFLPPEFVKGLSGGQRQWWEFKAKHMDKVLFFKVGKFYELYEMDAHVGVQDLDLQYMKGDQPHCGFPEKNYSENAARLARKGHRVLVVEQTETPEQLEIRKRKTGAKDKVVRREICAIVTKGTMVDSEMVGDNAETAYILAVAEKYDVQGGCTLGLCVVDASRALFMLGQIYDDAARTKLKSILAELRPVELVKAKGELSEATESALQSQSRKPLINSLKPSEEFWTAERTAKEINAAHSDGKLPDLLRRFLELGSEGEPAFSAFGGCVSYLKQALLDRQILKFGRIERLPGSDVLGGVITSGPKSTQENYMALDSAALENLDVLENSSNGSASGTLLSLVDHCVTPFGRRLLKQWIVRPLVNVESILERQNAIEDLQGVASIAVSEFRKELSGIPDIERLVSRLSATCGANGRDGDNVVLYEDAAKKKTKELLTALRGCKKMTKAVSSFQSCLDELTSQRLQLLITPGKCFPDLQPSLSYFENMFDWMETEKAGQLKLNEGVEEGSSAIADVEAKLDIYLGKQRELFKNDEISYVTVGKDTYLVEIPEQLHSKVPFEYELRSSRKGYRRYWTPEVKDLLQQLSSLEDQKDLASKSVLLSLTKRFCQDRELWLSAVQAVSELDALMSLSAAGLHMDGKVCKPVFRSDGAKVFNAKALRHPIMAVGAAAASPFVPNDVALGGNAPPFMLLTGPNMGGKSTLLRQVCLAIILAQIGANVPADALEISPVDRLFVRMGAKDHIMSGQSTFLTELLETASMLRCATESSFVALDELGRGTATSDGQAIAHAVLRQLAHNTQCRGLFSTHYHRLANDHAHDPSVALQHMACNVSVDADGVDAVTFLYKLTAGACPKSYGANVARLAGMPESVLLKAAVQSKEMEVRDQLRESLGNTQVQLLNDILSSNGSELMALWKNAKNIA